jgi:hypothetical protein
MNFGAHNEIPVINPCYTERDSKFGFLVLRERRGKSSLFAKKNNFEVSLVYTEA